MTTALLALTASVVIGLSDYLGGRASQRLHPMVVALVAQGTYLVVVPPLALAVGAAGPSGTDLTWGLVAGVASGCAYVVFFTALSTGRMGVVAPATAAVSAAVPVVVDLVAGVDLGVGQWTGVAVALVAVPLVAYTPTSQPASDEPTHGRTAAVGTVQVVGLAVVAGALFATFFICIGRTSTDSGQWPLAASSVTSTGSIAVALLMSHRAGDRPLSIDRVAVASGVTGAIAGACMTAALQRGPVAVASVLGSLFPLVTVALSARFSDERIRWWHVVGLGCAVAGAALIAT